MCTVTLILTAHDHVWRVCNIKTTNTNVTYCVYNYEEVHKTKRESCQLCSLNGGGRDMQSIS